MKQTFNGKEIEVVPMDVVLSNEYWNEYTLSDGSVIRTKDVLIAVHRAVSEKSPDGNPLYLVNCQKIVVLKGLE